MQDCDILYAGMPGCRLKGEAQGGMQRVYPKEQDTFARVGKMMQGISDLSCSGQNITDSFGKLRMNYREVRRYPMVCERRWKLKAEKQRPKNQKADGPEPDFF